ncbi:HD-GYP domain-containing protein, partial [Planctomycetota bacterium]
DGYILANGIRLRTERSAVEAHEWFLNHVADSGIERVTILPRAQPTEFRKFLPIFTQAEWKEEDTLPPPVIRDLENEFVVNIQVVMRKQRELCDEDEEEAEVSSQKLAMLLWFQLHTATVDLVEAVRTDQPLPLKRARTLMKLVVDLFMGDESALVAMTRMKYYVREGRVPRSAWEPYLESHMVNTAMLAVGLANRIGLKKRQLLNLGSAALVADVGMAKVPLELRDKDEELTPDEQEEVDRHVLATADAVLRSDELKAFNEFAAVIASEHHPRLAKRFTGGRPPSLYGAMVAIADTYDAMTTDRPWRGAWANAEVMPEIVSGDHGHDPLLSKAFANLVGVFPAGTVVELNTGELATVVGMSERAQSPRRPVVKLLVDPIGSDLRGDPVDLAERTSSGTYKRTITRIVDMASYAYEPGDLVALL